MALPVRLGVVRHAKRAACRNRRLALLERLIVAIEPAAPALAVVSAPAIVAALSRNRARHEEHAQSCHACQRFHHRSPLARGQHPRKRTPERPVPSAAASASGAERSRPASVPAEGDRDEVSPMRTLVTLCATVGIMLAALPAAFA